MVLLPLPLSPTRATISRAPMLRLTSSAAWSIRRDSGPPTRKCRVSPTVLMMGSAVAAATFGSSTGKERFSSAIVEQVAADEHVAALVVVGLDRLALRHHARASRMKAAARRRVREGGRGPWKSGQLLPPPADGRKRAHQTPIGRAHARTPVTSLS